MEENIPQGDQRRPQGLDRKEVFYCQRIKDAVDGNYFKYSDKKIVCNIDVCDPRLQFYLKIGGIVYAPNKQILGRKTSSCSQRFKESKYFGSYLFYCATDFKLRCITYCSRKGLPENKLVSRIGVLHSVIPRMHENNIRVIIGIKIDNTNFSDRQWTKFDELETGVQLHQGFYEMTNAFDLKLFKLQNQNHFRDFIRYDMKIAFYVTKNTSLLMIDETRMHLYNDFTRNYVYTVFQEGGLVCSHCNCKFKFYDIEESQMYTKQQFLSKRSSMPETYTFNNIVGTPVVFLKSAPNNTFWTLRVTRRTQLNGERIVQLGIPTGGQFECVLPWDEGIDEVIRRHSFMPWNKYTEPAKSKNFADIDMSVSEAYPQMNSYD